MKTLLYTTNDKESKKRLGDYVSFLDDYKKGKQVDYLIQIKQNRAVRSHSANGRYWVMLQAIAVQTGYSKDDLHEFYKKKFNSKEILGEVIGSSTTDLDTAEFSVYMKQVEDHAISFHDVYIAHSEDRHYSVWEQTTKDRYNAMYASI